MKQKQVLIAGGGAAGMMAAITAAREGAAVTLLEQEKKHLKVPIFERRGTLYALIATIVVLVIAVGLSGIYLYRTLFVIARMPDLSGIDQATAERMLASSGLRMYDFSSSLSACRSAIFCLVLTFLP